MDIQQAINLQLMDEFARRGIELAYPTTRQFMVTRDTRRTGATEAAFAQENGRSQTGAARSLRPTRAFA